LANLPEYSETASGRAGLASAFFDFGAPLAGFRLSVDYLATRFDPLGPNRLDVDGTVTAFQFNTYVGF
jgi:hypothetical protein